MNEPLEKDLSPGYHASLSENGTLTLVRVVTVTFFRWTITIPTTVQLPAVAVRALLNFLRREQSRKRIGYRLWQKEGSSQE